MAKSSEKKGSSANSTTSKSKPKAKRVAKTKTLSLGEEPPCSCCFNCEGEASGTLWDCEDDTCRRIPPASYPAFFISDPNRSPGGAGGFWCRPNQVPVSLLQDLFNELINTASQPTLLALGSALVNAAGGASALAALIAPHLNVSIMCSGCDCQCQGTISAS